MEIKLQKKNADKTFLKKIKQEAHVISNIQNIVDKINKDGFLSILRQTFLKVINNEIFFAVGELKKMDKRNSKKDLGLQLTNNTYIFKENLKKISGFIIDQIWKEKIKGDKINDTIKEALTNYRKGDFDEILEEEEDEFKSGENNESMISSENENSESESFSEEEEETEKKKIVIKEISHKIYTISDRKHKKKNSDTSLELKKENYKKNKKIYGHKKNLNLQSLKRKKIKMSESLKNINYSLNDNNKFKNHKQRDKILSIIRGGTELSKKIERNYISNSKNSSFSKKKVIQGSKSLRDIDYSFSAISGMFKKKNKKYLATKRKFKTSKDKGK